MLFHKKTQILASFGMFSAFALACTTAGTVKASQKAGTTVLVDSDHKGDSPTLIIRSDYKPGELTQLCQAAVKKLKGQLDQLVGLKPEDRNIQNTLLAFETMSDEFSDAVNPMTFMAYVSTDEKISEEGSNCEREVGKFIATVYTRKDLYEVLKSTKQSGKGVKLSAAVVRLQDETLKSFEDNGMHLASDQLTQLTTWKQELAELESQFSTNLNQDKSTLEFTAVELAGVPEDFLKSLKTTGDGKYIVTTKEPHYVRIMENASSGETRRRMMVAYENRVAKKNIELLEKAIGVRQKIAALLGFSTWADYRIHRRMAKDSPTVLTFLNGLKEKLATRNQEDLSNLQTFKREKEKNESTLNPWDIRFYSNLMQKEKFDLDSEKVREYFPADRVIAGLFNVYSTLFGVEYVEKKDGVTWDPSVKMYEIRNKSDKKLLAYFFADFFPRPGKYGHAAAFNLISGRQLGDHYSLPVSSIVANFSAAENGKPSLLPHEEVDTIFHEFGHIMHQTLTRAPYGSLSGSSVDQDFVEAPSQMLENWVYSPEILAMVSGHYLDPSKKLPKSMVQKIIAKRDFNQGYYYTRQLMLALTDMTYSTTSGPVDTTQVFRSIYKSVMSLEPVEDSHFQASFGHLMSGYDAGYYGYLWSEVYAADMFTRFEAEGLLNPKVGRQYRKYILEPGKMKDANVLLTKFLGRKPNNNAFLKKLHIPISD